MSVRCSSCETAACVMSRTFASCCCVRWRAARSSCSGISLRSLPARRRASARASGRIFARSSLNFVVFGIVFLLDLGKVVVVKLICQRYVLLVPTVVAGFVATQQQKRHAARIENVEHPVGVSLVLHPQLPHSGMARAVYLAAVRKWEMGTPILQQQDGPVDRYAFGFGESVPPCLEFIRNLDIPRHN